MSDEEKSAFEKLRKERDLLLLQLEAEKLMVKALEDVIRATAQLREQT